MMDCSLRCRLKRDCWTNDETEKRIRNKLPTHGSYVFIFEVVVKIRTYNNNLKSGGLRSPCQSAAQSRPLISHITYTSRFASFIIYAVRLYNITSECAILYVTQKNLTSRLLVYIQRLILPALRFANAIFGDVDLKLKARSISTNHHLFKTRRIQHLVFKVSRGCLTKNISHSIKKVGP
uniref:SFRICE_025041 n=1 Tax=Spodoptera frugiperda TaxID=7108 RepID=A0A2H1V1W4_SPOFR